MEKGNCFKDAGSMMFDFMNNTRVKLVHGEVTGQWPIAGVKFGHAWLEDDDNVFNVVGEEFHTYPKQLFYKVGMVEDEEGKLYKYSYDEFLKKLILEGNWGPWELTCKL